MFKMWNVHNMGCSRFVFFEMGDIQDVLCWEYGIFGLKNIWDVERLECKIWNVGCLLGYEFLVYKMPKNLITKMK